VKHYQRNKDDIRKLDAKYGNLVNMIQGLGQKHQPMLPTKEEAMGAERRPNERVEDWANAVSADGVDILEDSSLVGDEGDREGRFDRPLKEIRLGESPSRPWGISVPILNEPVEQDQRPHHQHQLQQLCRSMIHLDQFASVLSAMITRR
jgi:hypothetical protein